MIFKTIAASAAIGLGLLAVVPGVAMASTAGSRPPAVQVRCSAKGVKPGAKPGPAVVRPACCAAKTLGHKGGHVSTFGCCALLIQSGRPPGGKATLTPVAKPVPIRVAACGGQKMTFDLPAYSSTATEVRGPRLTVHELVIYRQRVFLISSVHGRSFTLAELFTGLKKSARPVRIVQLPVFTNGANAITDGHAVVLRASLALVVAIKRVP
jgi:hypothetical protein